MSTTNCLQPSFSSERKIVGLFAVLAFCATSIFAMGCNSGPSGKSCCGLDANNPEKLATVNESETETKTLGQSTDVTPSPESKERLDKTFGESQPGAPQTTSGAESSVASTSPTTSDSSQSSPMTQSLDSLDYVTTTNNPTNESNIPDVTPVQSAPVQPTPTPGDSQNTNGSSDAANPAPSSGYVSVAPSPNQNGQGEIVDHSAPSASQENSGSESNGTKVDSVANANSGKLTLEPPVEGKPLNAVSTFAEDTNASAESTKQPEANSGVSTQETPSSTNSENKTKAAETPQTPTTDLTLDSNVPVTFKPMALSRVEVVENTCSTEVVDLRASVSQRSVKRAPSGVSLSLGNSRVKPIDASKDSAHLTRIAPR